MNSSMNYSLDTNRYEHFIIHTIFPLHFQTNIGIIFIELQKLFEIRILDFSLVHIFQ